MLPTQPSTLVLVSRILRTGIRNLTVHCRTRDMRPAERAMWERLADIVELGKRRGLPITCNGDGDGWSNWERIRTETSQSICSASLDVVRVRTDVNADADSVMLARAAERNPSVFLPAGPRCNVTEVAPKLLNLAKHVDNPWGNTKFLLNQFKPSPPPTSTMAKAQKKEHQEAVNKSKSIDEMAEKMGLDLANHADVMREVEERINERRAREAKDTQGPDVFEERKELEDKGQVVDEEVGVEQQAEVDGWEVGVGQAEDEGRTAVAPQAADAVRA